MRQREKLKLHTGHSIAKPIASTPLAHCCGSLSRAIGNSFLVFQQNEANYRLQFWHALLIANSQIRKYAITCRETQLFVNLLTCRMWLWCDSPLFANCLLLCPTSKSTCANFHLSISIITHCRRATTELKKSTARIVIKLFPWTQSEKFLRPFFMTKLIDNKPEKYAIVANVSRFERTKYFVIKWFLIANYLINGRFRSGACAMCKTIQQSYAIRISWENE